MIRRRVRTAFQHKGWHSGVGQLVGFAAIIYFCIRLQTDWPWVALSLAVYFTLGACIRVGFHSLFAHRHFQTWKPLQWFLLIGGTLTCSGSSLQWALAHPEHHVYADAPGDPHNIKGWWSFLLFDYYYPDRYDFRLAKHLIHDPVHMWFHRYFWLFNGGVAACLAFASWWLNQPIIVYAQLLPVGCLLIMGGVHNVVAHRGGQPRNVWWYAPISFGEWAHANHHRDPGAYRFGKWDLGATIIDIIRSDKCPRQKSLTSL